MEGFNSTFCSNYNSGLGFVQAKALRIASPTPFADAGFWPVIKFPSTTTFSYERRELTPTMRNNGYVSYTPRLISFDVRATFLFDLIFQ